MIASGNYCTFYLTSVPVGQDRAYYGQPVSEFEHEKTVLQDLDNPAKTYKLLEYGVTSGEEVDNGLIFLTYENVAGKRLSLSSPVYESLATIFDEIVIGEPDAQ